MEIIPAIDIMNGECVRLNQGDFTQKTKYGKDPLDFAKQLEQAGLRHLHVVDLDAARSGQSVNSAVVAAICEKTNLVVDYGGGIRSLEQAKTAFSLGISALNIGSLAVREPAVFQRIIDEFGAEKIILSADVKDGNIAVNGWQENSGVPLFDFLEVQLKRGIRRVCCTDISRDGMLGGASIALYESILAKFPQIRLIASGGIGSMADIEALKGLGLEGVVVGKAIYEGRIRLSQLGNLNNE